MSTAVSCPNCKAIIGATRNTDGVELLELGGVACREVRGFCIKCGKAFHYCIQDKVLESIIRRVVENEREMKEAGG